MPDILLQFVTQQRDQKPSGKRILSDGTLQRVSDDTLLPGAADNLEKDRPLDWVTERTLPADTLQTIRAAITESGYFDLEPRLLINYCKEDPPTQIWLAEIDGQRWRVVVFDPRPKRSAALDKLSAALAPLLA